MIIKDVTDVWSQLTTAATFSIQNIGGYDAEVLRASSLPAATDRGFLILRGHGGEDTDFAGAGNLYARSHAGITLHDIQFAVEE